MVILVSAEWILPTEDASRDDIDEVDEVDAEDRHGGRYLAPCDDSECRDEESEHDRPRVAHDTLACHIEASECECRRDDDSEEDEEKTTIFLARERGICEDELQGESSEYDE